VENSFLPVFDYEAVADAADGERLALFPAELLHDLLRDVDVVALPTVFNYFSRVFLHVIILP